jgi:hypothetical protein
VILLDDDDGRLCTVCGMNPHALLFVGHPDGTTDMLCESCARDWELPGFNDEEEFSERDDNDL